MSDIEVVARLLAEESGEAVPMTRERAFPLSSRPLVLIPIQLAGEAPNLFAMGIADGTTAVRVGICYEPINRDEQYGMLLRCARQMTPFLDDWDGDVHALPQIVTPSRGSTKLVLAAFDRMCFAPGVPDELRDFGRRMQFFDHCFERPDSAALLDMPSAMGQLYATGQDENADQHLGAFVEWLKPADGRIHDRVRDAEGWSASKSTDPEVDNKYLMPLSEELRAARKAGDTAAEDRAKRQIYGLLSDEIKHRYRLIREGLRIISGFPDSEVADVIHGEDRRRYARHRDRAANPNRRMARGLKGAHGAGEFLERELAVDRIDAIKSRSVSGALAAARLAGEHVVGEVVSRTQSRNGGVLTVAYVIRSRQCVISLRQGDELVILDWPLPFGFEIDDVERDGEDYLVRAHVTKLKTKAGQPQEGDMVELAKPEASQEQMKRSMWLARSRLWSVQPRPQVTGQLPPTQDLLSIIRARRSQN